MHDFDPGQRERQEQRTEAFVNRSFTVRGETFTFRPNVPFSVLQELTSIGRGDVTFIGAHVHAIKGIIENTSSVEQQDVDGVLEDVSVTSHERWERVCDPASDFPVTIEDLVEIADWLVKEAVNRPTVPSSLSPPGPARNGTDSTGPSSGEQAEALTA